MAPDEPREPPTPAASRTYGTFTGVFTPTLLTILGVIMYLRLPWVVGHGGLLGGLLVVGLAVSITLTTGLSLSSIATNTRLGAGGPYAIIARSLGLEVAGSVGVPLYISQALAVAMYIVGFREGWLWLFPKHPALIVDLAVFAVVFAIAYISAGLAFRIQYGVMAVIAISLVAVLGNVDVWRGGGNVVLWGRFDAAGGPSFWSVFAVFFPAATGILAGANMSGELRDPRRSIPAGTLSAIGVSTVVYAALALWSSRAAPAKELVTNYTAMVDHSLYAPLVLAGLLGATFSSALSSLVGAPRILLALARDGVIPGGAALAHVSSAGEPRRGMLLTGALVIAALMARDLNAIAPLISMFFLITYAVINVVMLVESSLGLVSFRPTLRLPRVVPLLGTAGCLFAMFIVNPSFSLVAWASVVALYIWIMKRRIGRPDDDVRSGIFAAFAEWAASKVTELGLRTARAWKPSFLVPVVDSAELRGEFHLLSDLCTPAGSVKLLGIANQQTVVGLTPQIESLGRALRKRVFTTWSVLDSTDYPTGVVAGLQALRSAFFRPNVLFLSLNEGEQSRQELLRVLAEARRLKVSVLLCAMHSKAGLGRQAVINLWLRAPSNGDDVAHALPSSGANLAILCAYRLARAWQCELNLICAVSSEADSARARAYLDELRDLCRIPRGANTVTLVGSLAAAMRSAPQSDIDILGMSPRFDVAHAEDLVGLSGSTCLFAMDSGLENALA
ncbi:MAG: hypothetical protein KC503_11985 [Myxococcales bacterium]|nr:hypothetical protein [Myxococcales bacterium]